MHAILAQGLTNPSHDRLADTAGISQRSISKAIRELGPDGTHYLVGGHPARLGPGLGLALGLSIGSQSVRGALIDANGEIHHSRSAEPVHNQLAMSADALLSRLRSVAAEVLAAGLDDESLQCPIGDELALLGAIVAWPSPLDRRKQTGGWTLRDGSWRLADQDTGKVPTVPERMAGALGGPFTTCRCHAVHDASAHALAVAFQESREQALAESHSAGPSWRVALVVRIGSGLGAGTMLIAPHDPGRLSFIDSKLIEGTKGFAGELGHLRIDKRLIDDVNRNSVDGLAPIEYERWRCSCGRSHHLEAFASVSALVRRLEASGYEFPADGPTREQLLLRCLQGGADATQSQAAVDIGRILGNALAGPILMLDPTRVTVTGPLACDHLVRGIQREGNVWANVIDDSVGIGLDTSNAGEYIGTKGAGLALVRQKIYRDFFDKQAPAPLTFKFGRLELEDISLPLPRLLVGAAS